jgi:hypothetical protein
MSNSGTKNICLNKFESSNHSDAGTSEFVFYLSGMYMAVDPVLYGPRNTTIRALNTTFNNLRKEIEDDRGSRGEKTGEIYEFLDNLLKVVHEQYDFAVYALGGKKSLKLKEVFHGGLDLFYNLSRDKVISELDYLITKADKYAAELGAGFKTAFVDLRTEFISIRRDQTDFKDAISLKIVNKNKARLALTKELTSQYLLMCSEHVDDRDYVLMFFKFSIYTKHQKKHKNFVVCKGTVDPNSLLTVTSEIKPTNRLVIESKALVMLRMGGGTDDTSPLTASIVIEPNATVEVLFSSISTSGDTKLKAFNADLEQTASYIVKIYPS